MTINEGMDVLCRGEGDKDRKAGTVGLDREK